MFGRHVSQRAARSDAFGRYGAGRVAAIFSLDAAVASTVVVGALLVGTSAALSDRLWASAALGVFAGVQTVLFVSDSDSTLTSCGVLVSAYAIILVNTWAFAFVLSIVGALLILLVRARA